jgi:hypothetical protein
MPGASTEAQVAPALPSAKAERIEGETASTSPVS